MQAWPPAQPPAPTQAIEIPGVQAKPAVAPVADAFPVASDAFPEPPVVAPVVVTIPEAAAPEPLPVAHWVTSYAHVGVSNMRDAMACLPSPAAPAVPELTVMENARASAGRSGSA